MNASPAMDTGGPLLCFGRDGDPAVGRGGAARRARRAVDRPGIDLGRAPRSCWSAIDVPAPASGTGSCYVRLEYRRQMEIAVVGATAVVTVDGGVTDARIAITALTPTIRRVPEAEAALTGTFG